MPSFTTIFRAVVLVGVGVIVVKGWQLFGPSADQVKSAVVSAIDTAETAWKNWQPAGEKANTAVEPLGPAPQFSAAPAGAPAGPVVPPALSPAPLIATNAPVDALTTVPNPAKLEPAAPITEKTAQTTQRSTTLNDPVPGLMSRLEKLGATDPKLAPWGSSGHLYRFSCRAALANSPAFTQHFESVAETQELAVEQVVAKVEAWRMAQRNVAILR